MHDVWEIADESAMEEIQSFTHVGAGGSRTSVIGTSGSTFYRRGRNNLPDFNVDSVFNADTFTNRSRAIPSSYCYPTGGSNDGVSSRVRRAVHTE